MRTSEPRFKKYIFVCENKREEGDCCGPESERLRELLKKAVKDLGLEASIRVSRTGCLDVCSEGPNVLLMPDNVWFKGVREEDIPNILKTAGGTYVAKSS